MYVHVVGSSWRRDRRLPVPPPTGGDSRGNAWPVTTRSTANGRKNTYNSSVGVVLYCTASTTTAAAYRSSGTAPWTQQLQSRRLQRTSRPDVVHPPLLLLPLLLLLQRPPCVVLSSVRVCGAGCNPGQVHQQPERECEVGARWSQGRPTNCNQQPVVLLGASGAGTPAARARS